tara:strand:+ start:75 stop:365 length:291 start_codon:yes stop_codon:yes gene_type:complete
MADSRPDIIVSAGVPVDIYAALNAQGGSPSVVIGTEIIVQNKGSNPLYLHAGVDAPTELDGTVKLARALEATNTNGDLGAWVESNSVDGLINARVV